MKINPEIKGMLGIGAVILLIGFIMAASMGKFEQWFGWNLFSGPRCYDKILVTQAIDNKNEIVEYDLKTSSKTTLLSNMEVKDIDISPKGSKLAFVGYKDDLPQVYTLNPNGKKLKVITDIEGSKGKPQFSPNGKYLAYIANGIVFRADATGSNSFSMLPTRQQQQQSLSSRAGKLVMKDFVWSKIGEGMLGVVSHGEDNERLVIVSDNDGDAHEVPFPEGITCKFVSISAADDIKMYSAVAKIGDTYMVFVIKEPEEHVHQDAKTAEDMGVYPVYRSREEITNSVLVQSGAAMLMSIKSKNEKKMPTAVYVYDFEKKALQPAIPGAYKTFRFANDVKSMLLLTDKDELKMLNPEEKEFKTIFDKGITSFAVAPKNPNL